MRILQWKVIMLSAFITNLLMALMMWFSMERQCDCSDSHKRYTHYIRSISKKHQQEPTTFNDTTAQFSNIMVLIREFEFFVNDIPNTVSTIITHLPSATVLVLSDGIPYPPILFNNATLSNTRIVNLKSSLNRPSELQQPYHLLDRDHIFIFPDSTRVENITQMVLMLEAHSDDPNKIIAAPIDDSSSTCLNLNISARYWTIKYSKSIHTSDCNALTGRHVLLLTKAMLLQLGFPYTRPFPMSLFIQATLLKIKTKILKEVLFKSGKSLFSNPHLKWKHDVAEQQRKKAMYRDFGIKKIIYPESKVEWHGCSKTTARCFGSIVNNMPEYLFEDRWTPPCCIENLRQTARYVFGILEKCNVRYWLEGGSLLGAVRTGDIIPWDYDVDIGIYRDDIEKCEWLKNCLQQKIIDTQGFLWEKAREGEFIRIQFSETNHLHVDIFPFYSRNGTMTKDSWFMDHKQDTEFPEHFLQPLYWIKFVGVKASAPNNYREFLELKFGKGVVENPEYPDPKVMKFARRYG